ncbi:tripartite tricarboxylate transporter TctB family protein [Saccharopolyspora sp. WRP15-2]|uniref:Tripartite tricarboxylate transporter TctB family protein n=1 Tax=Saccharopolyspora oryzae TaxID=2997343 RepID=A0ABT4V718_9PSEU|nr:tripartite tricarboxylate transporter TctB family protein [Saccharopolyspora oryzae]MDA3629765.1 tripartite tricarboxylate transporter TctB family protein [Saccharopolyspora oryzae]
MAAEPQERRTALSSTVFGGLMVVAAILVIIDALALPDTGKGAAGPAAVPLALGVLLGVVGLALALRSSAALRTAATDQPLRQHAALRLAALVAALVAFALLLPVLGYVVTSAGLFVAAALLLGAPRGWQIVAHGWSLAAVVFVVFDRIIGLTLPAGPWGF